MELIAATHNKGKLVEFTELLRPLNAVVVPLDALDLNIEIEETGTTFAENARIKAETIFKLTGRPAIADDSGLCVDALEGAPGVYSARYGGPGLTDAGRVQKLLAALEGVPQDKRGAHFVSAICCVLPDTVLETQGYCYGRILPAPQGDNGFGYDPVFLPEEYAAEGRGFGMLSRAEKNAISHRGRAIAKFAGLLEAYVRTKQDW